LLINISGKMLNVVQNIYNDIKSNIIIITVNLIIFHVIMLSDKTR
jgi:hypothetical protein